jgi:hypothetical protein
MMRLLARIVLLSGIGRMISVLVVSWPHWLQVAVAGVELVLPLVFFWPAGAGEKAAASRYVRYVVGARLPPPWSDRGLTRTTTLDALVGRGAVRLRIFRICVSVGVVIPAGRVDALSPQSWAPPTSRSATTVSAHHAADA